VFSLGVVGLNLYGKTFINALSNIEGVKVVAICPESNELLEPFASTHNLRTYPDLEEMLGFEKLDGVILATYSALHEQLTLTALTAGLHVFVDRPLSISLDSCHRMELAAKANNRVLMVGHVIRFWPEYVAIREIIAKGKLGKPKVIVASRVSGLIDCSWRSRLLNPNFGLGVLEAHIHDIDYLIGLFGQPEIRFATGSHSLSGAVVQLFSLLQFNNECIANIEADYSVPNNYPLQMYLRITGERASVLFNFSGALSTRDSASRSLVLFENDGRITENIDITYIDPYQDMLNHFIKCAKEDREPNLGTAHQSSIALDTVLKIRKSINSNQLLSKITK